MLLALLLFMTTEDIAPRTIPWRGEAYTHMASDESLQDLLRGFLANQGIVGVISEAVDGKVNGRFQKWTPNKFFNHMTSAYGLIWYYDGATLYIYRGEETISQMFTAPNLGLERLRRALSQVDILDPRFPLRAIEEEGILYVSGPARYVDLVEETIQMLEANARHQMGVRAADLVMRVFPLKYAWADDMVFENMRRQVRIPGVATLLRELTQGNTPKPELVHQLNTVPKLRGQGLANRGMEPEEVTEENGDTVPMDPYTTIQADIRANAVVVRTRRDRMAHFEELIASLDVPTGMVEVKATIIDISRDKSRELGIDWSYHKKNGGTQYGGGSNQQSNNDPLGVVGSGLNLATLITNATSSFMARIRALEHEGTAQVISKPSVLTADNMAAHMEHNTTFYVRVAGEREVDLFPVTTGVSLMVKPHIVQDPGGLKIKLGLKIEDGSLTQSSVDQIPVVTNSIVNTQAVLGLGESLLLGGNVHEEVGGSVEQVPGLGKVPVVKHLFRKNRKVDNAHERLFLIEARVVNHQTQQQQNLQGEN